MVMPQVSRYGPDQKGQLTMERLERTLCRRAITGDTGSLWPLLGDGEEEVLRVRDSRPLL